MTSTGGAMHPMPHDWLRDVVEEDSGTAGDMVVRTVVPDSTRTVAALLTENADDLRQRVANLSGDIPRTHQRTYEHEWQLLTQQRGIQSPIALLDDLANLGFAWRDIARLTSVSVPAVQKWRKGERLSGASRLKLAKLIAACDFIASHFYIGDIASWFEMRIIENVPITPIDLWAKGHQLLLFEYVTRHLTPDETLDRFDPDWRERYRTNFITFLDEEGRTGPRLQKE